MARILIATADTLLLETLRDMLEGDRHEVTAASDGQAAYETGLDAPPDLVFVDASLPVFTGFETCQMFREDPDFPVSLPIFLISNLDEDSRKLERFGLTGAVTRTVSAWELNDLVVKHVRAEALP